MIPKSTAKLAAGDCCFIPCSDGRFVPFVFICKEGNARSYFIGGLVGQALESDDASLLESESTISAYAMLHIQCYARNDTPVAANIADKLADGEFERIERASRDMSVGSKHRVWGYRAVFKVAEEIADNL